jgi:hypothetical protein
MSEHAGPCADGRIGGLKAVREKFDNIYIVIENELVMKNVVSWFDIPTEDFDRAVKFYIYRIKHV